MEIGVNDGKVHLILPDGTELTLLAGQELFIGADGKPGTIQPHEAGSIAAGGGAVHELPDGAKFELTRVAPLAGNNPFDSAGAGGREPEPDRDRHAATDTDAGGLAHGHAAADSARRWLLLRGRACLHRQSRLLRSAAVLRRSLLPDPHGALRARRRQRLLRPRHLRFRRRSEPRRLLLHRGCSAAPTATNAAAASAAAGAASADACPAVRPAVRPSRAATPATSAPAGYARHRASPPVRAAVRVSPAATRATSAIPTGPACPAAASAPSVPACHPAAPASAASGRAAASCSAATAVPPSTAARAAAAPAARAASPLVLVAPRRASAAPVPACGASAPEGIASERRRRARCRCFRC